MEQMRSIFVQMRSLANAVWDEALMLLSDRDTLLVILVTALVLLLFRLMRSRFWVFFHLTFLSTLMHELSHYIVALILNGRPSGMSIFPERNGNHYVLGKVEATNIRWYNGTAIALAPLSLFFLAFAMLPHIDFSRDHAASLVGKFYVTASFVQGGLPSNSDLQIAIKYGIVPLTMGLLAVAVALWA